MNTDLNLQARPNSNGNSAADFREAYHALTEAQKALQSAQRVMHANVLHGRNYQHGFADVREENVITVNLAFRAADDQLGDMMRALRSIFAEEA